jgi:hypothetical protein
MKAGTESAEPRLDEAFDEIAEGLVLVLANSLRWLATQPRSTAMLLVEGFVCDGEVTLVVDMPRQSSLDRPKSRRTNGQRTGGPAPKARALQSSTERGLRVFTLPLASPGQ